MTGESLATKKDIYYTIAIIAVVGIFGVWIIPQTTQFLILYAFAPWFIILIVCVALPLIALALLWLIIQEIQSHYKELELSEGDEEIEESPLMDEAFSEEDEKFIEEKMREQLEAHKFEDEDVLELSRDLILTYVTTRLKKNKVIPLIDISNELDIPLEVVTDILLLLIADNLVDGMVEKDGLVSSD